MNTAPQYQHVTLAGVIVAIAGAVTWLSFTQEPAAAFLFPRVISVFFLALALWNLLRAAAGMTKTGAGLTFRLVRNVWPGLVVLFAYAFFAAKALGFYSGSAAAFLTLYTLYDPTPWSSVRGWARRIIVTLLFMGVMYVLFALLLKVHAPRGLFF